MRVNQHTSKIRRVVGELQMIELIPQGPISVPFLGQRGVHVVNAPYCGEWNGILDRLPTSVKQYLQQSNGASLFSVGAPGQDEYRFDLFAAERIAETSRCYWGGPQTQFGPCVWQIGADLYNNSIGIDEDGQVLDTFGSPANWRVIAPSLREWLVQMLAGTGYPYWLDSQG